MWGWQRLRSPWVWIGGMAGIAVGMAVWPLWRQGYPYTHSIGSNALWAYQFGQQVLAGQIYPRWLEQSFASLGSPTFVFYPPLCMWGVVPFAALGGSVMEQLIGSIHLCVGLMAIGAWGVGRAYFPGRFWIQGLGVGVAVLSPYFLINIHVRGAMGEMWAMVALVWILWGLEIQRSGPQAWRLLPLTGAIGLLALSHLPTLLLFVLTWIPLPLVTLEIPRSELGLRSILKGLWGKIWELYLPLGLGLGLASFFLLPPIFDQPLININYISIATPTQRLLVDGILQFSPQLTEHDFDRQLLWIFGITLGTVLGVMILGWALPRLKLWTVPTRVVLWGTLFPLAMTTDLGTVLYSWVGALERIQFSWRWLAISSICWPWLWCTVLASLPLPRSLPWRWGLRLIGLGTTVGVLIWSTGIVWGSAYPWPWKAEQLDQFFRDRPIFPEEADLTATPYEAVDFALLRNHLGQPFMTDVSEYTPVWAPAPPHLPSRNYDLIEWIQGEGEILDLDWEFGYRRFQVKAPQGGELLLRMYSWPGWQVQVGDRVLEGVDHGQDGRLRIRVPEGETEVEVRYGGSQAERWGWRISGLTVIGLGVILRAHRSLRRILGVSD